MKVWEVCDDDLINGSNPALKDTESNLIVRGRFQMLTLSPLYSALDFVYMLYVLGDLP